jgi:hypothetical protein
MPSYNPLYNRKGKYQFLDAARTVLDPEECRLLQREWDELPITMVFGEFLHTRHPEVFAQLLAWMKCTGRW